MIEYTVPSEYDVSETSRHNWHVLQKWGASESRKKITDLFYPGYMCHGMWDRPFWCSYNPQHDIVANIILNHATIEVFD